MSGEDAGRHATEAEAATTRAAACAFFAGLDGGRGAALEGGVAPGFAAHLAGVRTLDAAAFAGALAGLYTAFPDLRHEVIDVIVEGEQAALRLCERGTHAGAFQGIAATGRSVAVSALAILRFERGKVAELWLQVDAAGRLAQLQGSA